MDLARVVTVLFAFIAAAAVTRLVDWHRFVVPSLFLAASIPYYIIHIESAPPRTNTTDISTQAPSLTLVGLLAIGLFMLVRLGHVSPRLKKAGFGPAWPILAYLITFYLFVWERTPDVRAGVLSILISIICWWLGQQVGMSWQDSEEEQLALVRGLALFLVCELILTLYQSVNNVGVADRMMGSYTHPAWLGKYVLLAMPFLLPMLVKSSMRVMRLSAIGLVSGVAATGLTLSRANLVSQVGAVLVWVLLVRGDEQDTRWRSMRPRILIAMGLAVLPIIGALVARFEADPEGGDRSALWDAGISIINKDLWTGTGPNNYVNLGRSISDFVDYSGTPIHNLFMLLVAELGVAGMVVMLLPWAASTFQAIRSVSRNGALRLYSLAFLISTAAIVFTATTGWGFLQEPTIDILFLWIGFYWGYSRSERYAAIPTPEGPVLASTHQRECADDQLR